MAADQLIPAAQYLRMSTERQQYSLQNQAAAIQRCAEFNGFEVVRTYADSARSGVVLKRRQGLQQLLKDVIGGQTMFRAILVYNVSHGGVFRIRMNRPTMSFCANPRRFPSTIVGKRSPTMVLCPT